MKLSYYRELNELLFVQCFEQCLAHGRYYISGFLLFFLIKNFKKKENKTKTKTRSHSQERVE